MLTAHHLYKSYNINTILKDVTFSVNAGERVGLIGPNGCGKTTLLRILAGKEPPDEGIVTLTPANLRLGYLPQGMNFDLERSVGELLREVAGNPERAEDRLVGLANALAREPNRSDLQEAYDDALRELEQANQSNGQTRQILAALGLAEVPDGWLVSALSGGQKTRLSLALVLLAEPELLLLDEPTNHLDIEMLEWLERWLSGFAGAALIVSHDRTFLDRTVHRILDLDPETHGVRSYTGNYTDYLEQYLAEKEKMAAAYRDQRYEIRKMREDINKTRQQALRVELSTTSRQPGVRRYAKKVAKKAKSREKKLERYLNSDERIEKPKQSWQIKLEFQSPAHISQKVLSLVDLSVGYPGYPPLLSGLNLNVQAGSRIALTGRNGSGKTTLLRTIAGELPPLAGSVQLGSSIRLGYMSQEQELIDLTLSPLQAVQARAPLSETEARNFLHFFLFSGDDPLRPAGSLSFGERARLALALLIVEGCNFLLLDEPINHLDIPSRVRFEQALSQFEGSVLAVVHDRYFIQQFATGLWLVKEGGLLSLQKH